MTPLSKTYKELGIAFEFPIAIKDEDGNVTYFENSDGLWSRREYENGKRTYFENSAGYWCRSEFGANGNETYYENSDGSWYRKEFGANGKETYYENSSGNQRGTKRGSCAGKVIEIDGKKYKLTEL